MDLPSAGHLNLISLCTGGGGLDLGVELAIPNARSVVYVEREAYAIHRLVEAFDEGRLAAAPIWSDVATFTGRPWRGLVDGVIGGIPCQPHSLAGKRGGSTDERDLWSDARRIIAQARPWFVLIENVGGMLSAGDDEVAGANRVRRDLFRMGFSVEGGLFTAEEVGFPHERERVFILGVADASRIRFEGGGPGAGGEPQRESPSGRRLGDGGDSAMADAAHRDGRGGERGTEAGARTGDVGRRRSTGGGPDVADPAGAGWQGSERRSADRLGQRPATERGGEGLVDSTGLGRREGQPEPELRRGRDAAGGADQHVVDAHRGGHHRGTFEPERGPQGGAAAERPGEGFDLAPPGPSDRDAWDAILAERPDVAPAISGLRRVADGVDYTRIDELRLLGNGVHPLAAAYAVRTLGTRLGARGSAGAKRLVRMMEAA